MKNPPAIRESFYPSGQGEESLVLNALERGIRGDSEAVGVYEDALGAHFGAENVIATSSGYGSLVVALSAMGLKPGDNVLLTPTCPLCTVYALTFLRIEPVFCDIRPDDFTLDLSMAEKLVNGRTRAIIDIPMWGYPVDAESVSTFARSRNLWYLLDIALAHKAIFKERLQWQWADIATFSTHHSKTLVTGEGGGILTDNAELAGRARAFIRGGFTGEKPGLNFSLSGLQAALGKARLSRLETDVQHRRQTMRAITSRLTNPFLEALPVLPGGEPAGTRLLIRTTSGSNKSLLDHQLQAGIPSDIALYDCKALYQYPVLRDRQAACPNAERMLASLSTIPVHPEIGADEIDTIVSVLNRFRLSEQEEGLL